MRGRELSLLPTSTCHTHSRIAWILRLVQNPGGGLGSSTDAPQLGSPSPALLRPLHSLGFMAPPLSLHPQEVGWPHLLFRSASWPIILGPHSPSCGYKEPELLKLTPAFYPNPKNCGPTGGRASELHGSHKGHKQDAWASVHSVSSVGCYLHAAEGHDG